MASASGSAKRKNEDDVANDEDGLTSTRPSKRPRQDDVLHQPVFYAPRLSTTTSENVYGQLGVDDAHQKRFSIPASRTPRMSNASIDTLNTTASTLRRRSVGFLPTTTGPHRISIIPSARGSIGGFGAASPRASILTYESCPPAAPADRIVQIGQTALSCIERYPLPNTFAIIRKFVKNFLLGLALMFVIGFCAMGFVMRATALPYCDEAVGELQEVSYRPRPDCTPCPLHAPRVSCCQGGQLMCEEGSIVHHNAFCSPKDDIGRARNIDAMMRAIQDVLANETCPTLKGDCFVTNRTHDDWIFVPKGALALDEVRQKILTGLEAGILPNVTAAALRDDALWNETTAGLLNNKEYFHVLQATVNNRTVVYLAQTSPRMSFKGWFAWYVCSLIDWNHVPALVAVFLVVLVGGRLMNQETKAWEDLKTHLVNDIKQSLNLTPQWALQVDLVHDQLVKVIRPKLLSPNHFEHLWEYILEVMNRDPRVESIVENGYTAWRLKSELTPVALTRHVEAHSVQNTPQGSPIGSTDVSPRAMDDWDSGAAASAAAGPAEGEWDR